MGGNETRQLCSLAMVNRAVRSTLFHIISIIVIGGFIYGNTFSVPFQWDEEAYIRDNTTIQNLGNFLHPSRTADLELHHMYTQRFLSYFTFALNYHLHGNDVTGYHVVNIAIHLMNALLLYFLVRLLFRTPRLKDATIGQYAPQAAWLSALLFVAHPVQTEAVTYIFQRHASLMAMFYLLSISLFIYARLTRQMRYLIAATLMTIMAMLSKENALTIPLAALLVEITFFEGRISKRVLYLLPLFLTLPIIPLTHGGGDTWHAAELVLQSLSPAEADPYRTAYLLTQARVLITYLRLLVLPINQTFDYDYPLYHSFAETAVWGSFLALLIFFCFAIFLIVRARRGGAPELALMGFGIIWLFLTISIESSIFPIPMVINEYRLYLPSAGAFIFLVAGTHYVMNRFTPKHLCKLTMTLFLIAISFGIASHMRNGIWQTRTALWEDTVQKSPQKARTHRNLGRIYEETGRFNEALTQYREAINLNNGFVRAYIDLAYLSMKMSKYELAANAFKSAIMLDDSLKLVRLDLGLAYSAMGKYRKAESELKSYIRNVPTDSQGHYYLGLAYMNDGDHKEALDHFEHALGLKADYHEAHNSLGYLYLETGDYAHAIEQFTESLKEVPQDHFAAYGLMQAKEHKSPGNIH
jgi:tetratricopeptide (TPR) repeat protein